MTERKTYLLLVAATAFWGANFVVGKAALQVLPPLTVGAWRFLIAALCMTALLWARERPLWATIRPALPLYAVLGVVGIFGFNGLLFAGLQRTTPVNAALVMATNPLLTALLARVLFGEQLRSGQVGGAVVALAGVGFVLTGGSLAGLGSISIGDMLVLGGNACWALYSLLGRRYGRGSSPLALTTASMVVGALCFLPFATPDHLMGVGPREALLTAGAITFMALCGSVLAYLWWVRGVARLGASATALFFNLVPVWTLLFTVAGGGRVTVVQGGGALLVLAGVGLASARRPVAPPAARQDRRAA